jgi:hypothetical protein
MNHADVIGWVLATVASFLRLRQAKTLGVFVAAALRVGRVCLPAIGEGVRGGSMPKHRDECWFLMTDLEGEAGWLSELYGRRMLDPLELTPAKLLAAVRAALSSGREKWG